MRLDYVKREDPKIKRKRNRPMIDYQQRDQSVRQGREDSRHVIPTAASQMGKQIACVVVKHRNTSSQLARGRYLDAQSCSSP